MALIKCPECKKQISETVENCPHCGYKFSSGEIDNLKRKEQKTKVIGFAILIILIFIFIKLCSGGDESETKITQEPRDNSINETSVSINQSESLQFEIVEKQDISFANNPRMVNRIVLKVDSLPSKQEMENTATLIWENGNKDWKEFTVFIYLPEMNTRQSAYGIGEFNANGLVKFVINVSALYGSKWEIKKIDKPIEKVSAAKLKEYSIKITTVKLDKRKVKVIVNTDFPDGTNILVSVGRIHYLQGDSDEYSGEIFDKDFSIKQGKIETIVKVNDFEWYNEHLRLVKALPDDIKPISKISDNITIEVLYTSAANQPMNVTEILGATGEFVTGKGVEKYRGGTIGLLTTLNVSKELNMPFEK